MHTAKYSEVEPN